MPRSTKLILPQVECCVVTTRIPLAAAAAGVMLRCVTGLGVLLFRDASLRVVSGGTIAS